MSTCCTSGVAQYYVLTAGLLLNTSAYVGILVLQSSINIVGNIGTTCASILYLCAIFLLLTATPVMLLRIGPKWCLIVGEIGFLFYTLGNFFSSYYSMIPGAVIGSLGEAFVWSSAPLIVTHLVKETWEKRDKDDQTSQSIDHLRNKWFGHFYAILKASQIIGNILSYVVLYGGRHLNVNTTKPTTDLYSNLSMCGSRYCYDSHHQTSAKNKYVPQSRWSILLLVGIYALMQVASFAIHSFSLKKIVTDDDNPERRPLHLLISSIKTTFRHILSLDNLLLMPVGFYYGGVVSYAASNFTMAFVSCTTGVQQVGLVMCFYGVSNVSAAFAVGRLAHRFGIVPVVTIGFALDLSDWLTQLFWMPTLVSRYYWTYVIASMLGASDGIWQTTASAITALFYADRAETAFASLSLYTVLGLFFGFFLSGRICVRMQIFLMIGNLALVAVGYAVAEARRRRRKSSDAEKQKLMPNNQEKDAN